MEKNEIKKLIYKQNPIAKFSYIRKGIAYYKTTLKTEDKIYEMFNIDFEIPVSDMGEADFRNEMESKFLNRWVMETVSAN